MKAYKGFDKDLKCRGFQYEVGKEYTEEEAEICSRGFHACENPMDVFGYYSPGESRYCEVELDDNGQRSGDSKRVGTHIKISEEIGLLGLIKAGTGYIMQQIDWDNKKKSNTGDCSAATNTGNYSAATNTGDRSTATNTGNCSSASVKGEDSVAVAVGIGSKAKGSIGCFIILAEWEDTGSRYHIKELKAAKVDGEYIKPDTFYILKGGEFIEVEQEGDLGR